MPPPLPFPPLVRPETFVLFKRRTRNKRRRRGLDCRSNCRAFRRLVNTVTHNVFERCPTVLRVIFVDRIGFFDLITIASLTAQRPTLFSSCFVEIRPDRVTTTVVASLSPPRRLCIFQWCHVIYHVYSTLLFKVKLARPPRRETRISAPPRLVDQRSSFGKIAQCLGSETDARALEHSCPTGARVYNISAGLIVPRANPSEHS